MSEALSIAKAIQQTIEECIDKVNSVDEQVQKLRDAWANIEWPNFKAQVNSSAYTDLLDKSFIKRTDTLTAFNDALKSMIDFIEEEGPTTKEETKKPEPKKQPEPEPKKESDYEYYDEEESEASDFDEKEKQAKEAQQKKSEPKKQPEPEPKKEPEPTLTQIQHKNEAFFQDVMRILTEFTTKLESMLREHLDIKKKDTNPEHKQDESTSTSTSESEQKTISSIDDSSINEDN